MGALATVGGVARNVRTPLAACVACAAGFVLLALLGRYWGPVGHLDASLLLRTAESGSRAGSVAAGVASLGDPLALLAMLALACAIAIVGRRPRCALAALAVVAGTNLSAQLLKLLLAHPRFQAALGADQIDAGSFPSGHATAAASIAIAFAFVVPRELRLPTAVAGACLVAVVGWSVLALRWHYPSDVLGGILFASGWGFATLAALRASEGAPWRRAQLPRRPAISVK
jgi:membrane-associated phospholipid phosphatase